MSAMDAMDGTLPTKAGASAVSDNATPQRRQRLGYPSRPRSHSASAAAQPGRWRRRPCVRKLRRRCRRKPKPKLSKLRLSRRSRHGCRPSRRRCKGRPPRQWRRRNSAPCRARRLPRRPRRRRVKRVRRPSGAAVKAGASAMARARWTVEAGRREGGWPRRRPPSWRRFHAQVPHWLQWRFAQEPSWTRKNPSLNTRVTSRSR